MTEPIAPDGVGSAIAATAPLRSLQRRLARERSARLEAEMIAEQATRDLYDSVQELVRSSKVTELLGDVAALANEASSVAEALGRALASVCDYTGWPIGHALLRSASAPDQLQSGGVWHVEHADRYRAFQQASRGLVFQSGIGLPGRVLQSGKPAWIADVHDDENFVRRAQARDAGLAAGFAIPILIRAETAAVLEFFATEIKTPDASMLRVVTFVGAQLGRVMEREAAEERLRHLALYDGLTGLPNRLLLMDRLRGSMTRAQRVGARVGVLYLDVDDFKTINDSRGHGAGDAVLTALAARLQEAIRGSDTVALAAPWTLARLGGDEFAIVLEDCDDPDPVTRRIESLLKGPLELDDAEVFVSVSIGIASAVPTDTTLTAEGVLAAANVAMHEAKRAGKSRHVAFEPRMHDEARRRHELGEELHRAVSKAEFELLYQPVVTLSDGTVTGAEALIRWRHPSLGTVCPVDFIGRAEETGLIVPIGTWVLRQACQQAHKWRQDSADFTIAVNVSGRQLREPDFLDVVRDALAASELPPHALCLEMTESILMERDDEAIAVLTELRGHGVHLAIDDFGTGYSSLGALRRLPVDLLKIDRSFVASLPQDDDAGTIAWAIVRLGHTLGMPVLAEGVETLAQRDALHRFGCDQAQGYLFGRPLTAQSFEAVLS
ncbi:MAG: hypothetical protein NVSMB55_18280 [Mycobacteriales bacterium]